MEQTLTKEEILELYLNQIFFGHRAYGVAAAADLYYGKDLDQLDVAQMAMLAGLPKAPSSNNPIYQPGAGPGTAQLHPGADARTGLHRPDPV